MAGTTLSWKTTNIILGAGKLFANVAIPAAAARMTLDATTKTPDSTANPLAIHLGATQAGTKVMIKSQIEDYFVDEFAASVATNVSQVDASMEGALVGVTDMDLLALLTPGMGTKGTGSGYDEVTMGQKAIAYTSIALIAPLIEDTTKVIVVQFYKALNTTGIEINFGRKDLAFTPFNFKAYEVTTRAAADTLANIYKEKT
jgi:hypothetical protein